MLQIVFTEKVSTPSNRKVSSAARWLLITCNDSSVKFVFPLSRSSIFSGRCCAANIKLLSVRDLQSGIDSSVICAQRVTIPIKSSSWRFNSTRYSSQRPASWCVRYFKHSCVGPVELPAIQNFLVCGVNLVCEADGVNSHLLIVTFRSKGELQRAFEAASLGGKWFDELYQRQRADIAQTSATKCATQYWLEFVSTPHGVKLVSIIVKVHEEVSLYL